MSVADVFEIGRSALGAARTAIDVTGQNIANVNTPGYSKLTPLFVSQAGIDSSLNIGRGVTIAEVTRYYDDFLQKQQKSEASIYGANDATNNAMMRVEQLFNEFTANGVGSSLSAFYNSWQDLANNPQGIPERQAVLAKASVLVADFHRINTNLNDIRSNMNANLRSLVNDVNVATEEIARLNGDIQVIEVRGGSANELRDKRELLVRELSKKVSVSYIEDQTGMLQISLSSGQLLVDRTAAGVLSVEANPANQNFYDIRMTPPNSKTATDITASVGGSMNSLGEIGGTLAMRDSFVTRYLSQMDELAAAIANQVNAIHSVSYGVAGSTGQPFFSVPAVVAGYSGSAGIAVNISNFNDVAASDTDPTLAGGGTGNNRSALAIAKIRDLQLAFSTGTATIDGFYGSILGTVGVDAQSAKAGLEQSDRILKQLDSLRESQSGVSLDEEMANLIRYQRSYEGAAKLINVGTEMIDTLLDMVR